MSARSLVNFVECVSAASFLVGLTSFELRGVTGSVGVSASYGDGILAVDPLLRRHAQLLVDLVNLDDEPVRRPCVLGWIARSRPRDARAGLRPGGPPSIPVWTRDGALAARPRVPAVGRIEKSGGM